MSTATDTDFSGEVPTTFRQKLPFSDSKTATKFPKPGLPIPKVESAGFARPLIAKFRERFGKKADLQRIADQQAGLEAESEKVRELVSTLNGLSNDAERAKEQLTRADAEFEDLKRKRTAAGERARTMWGQQANTFTGQATPMEVVYGGFADIDVALTDYPNARKVLAAAAEDAEKKLSDFREQHDLSAEED